MDRNKAKTSINNNQVSAEVLVGRKLRDLRASLGFSLRALADKSGLNVNTLSLIENGKSSPSVSTLQQLALALNVPMTAFFESDPVKKSIVFTPADQRPQASIGSTRMQNLAKDLSGNNLQPFLIELEPGMGSGRQMIVHSGFEFVFCLDGSIHYRINEDDFHLATGDSLVFEAHLPHCWENNGSEKARLLLVLNPSDVREKEGGRHFSPLTMKKEINMKIAVITDDGKTISKHFGRASYYQVLTIEEGKITNRELRNKIGHSHFAGQEHAEEHQHENHGRGDGSHSKHVSMAETIADCKAVLCGGMGMGAYESMRRLNIQPVVTDLDDIDEAAKAFVDGNLIDHTELLH